MVPPASGVGGGGGGGGRRWEGKDANTNMIWTVP